MKRATLLLLCASFLFVWSEARTGAAASSDQKDAAKVEERAQAAAAVLSEIMNVPDKGIPKDFSVSEAGR